MFFRNALTGAIASAFLLSACGGSDLPLNTPQIASTFGTGVDGWKGAYADYTADTEPTDVVWESRALPQPLSGNAYFTGGTNKSDDLFIYSKKKFGGYQPSKRYMISFDIEIATNQSSGCVGVGGAPGESVYVVAGAAPAEPKTVLAAGEYRVNLERGNQATPGKASQVLGNVANTVPNCGPQVYQLKTVKSTAPLAVQSDANGDIWVFFGIDSGFEAKSTVFYKSFKASVAPAP
jgi:hypothetical protein